MERMVALAPPTMDESYVEPSPYAWLRSRAPVPTTYAPACEPLYRFRENLENRTSRARGIARSCAEVSERNLLICIEIWQVEMEGCDWRVSFHKYGFVHGDPIQGIDPTGLSWLDDLSYRGILAHISFSVWAKLVRPHTNPGASLRDLFGMLTGPLAPDLVDTVSKEFFELKPISHRSSYLANADDLQMWSYELYFGLFHPGEGYKRGNQNALVPYAFGGMPIGVMTEGNNTAVLMVWPSPSQIGQAGNLKNGEGLVHYEWIPLPRVPRTRQEPIFREVPVMVTERVVENRPVRFETWDPIYQPLIPHQIMILNTQTLALATGVALGGAILAMAGIATMNSMMGGFA
jgi:hypothetical protein